MIVGSAGAILLVVSLYQLYEGLTGRFAQDNKVGRMKAEERRVFMSLGRIGLSARAVVCALIRLLRPARGHRLQPGHGCRG